MFEWFKRKEPSLGTVMFRGTMPPRLREFVQFAAAGVKVEELPAEPQFHWKAKLTHPTWGPATLSCMRNHLPVPDILVRFDPSLTDEEKDAAATAGSSVAVGMEPRDGNVLRDRKRLLRFLRLVLGDDGVLAGDLQSQKFWSRDMLDDELIHDADLDVESLFISHMVHEGEGDNEELLWLHTHGLKELGTVDFDIMRPSPLIGGPGYDVVRALAFALLEGEAKPGEAVQLLSGLPPFELVPVERFNREAPEDVRAIRGDPADETHNRRRVILCEPKKKSWLPFLRSRKCQPSKALSMLTEDRMMCHFTNAATDLMSARAQATVGVFEKLHAEFGEMEFGFLAKIGYTVDGGKPEEREHMWFEIDKFAPGQMEGTLLNQPFNIARMNQGDRGWHPVEKLTDWQIFTPAGTINPRGMKAARVIRANKGAIMEIIAEHKRKGN